MKNVPQTILILTIMGLLACTSAQTKEEWVSELPKPWTLSQDEMDKMLPLFQETFPDFQTRLKQFALWRVGTPYEIFKLGEGVEPDPDPIIRYDVSDCTGHILTSLAAASSASWDGAMKTMIDIHYKADETNTKHATYASRWHFTTDRITANPYTVNITEQLLPISKLDSVNITLNQKDSGEELLALDWDREMTVRYIPNDQITPELMAKLPAIVGVTFVKPAFFKLGIVMGHEGMIIDGKYLVHASQSAGETVKLDFLNYYFPEDGAFFGGIMIFEFKDLS